MNKSAPAQGGAGSFFRLQVRPWGLLQAAGALAALAAVAGFFGGWAWWLDLFSHFRVQYAALFAAVALAFALGRRWRWAAGSGLFALANLLPVLPLLLPAAAPADPGGPGLRALLLNVNTRLGRPAAVMAEIRRQRPDVVVLLEVSDRWMRELAPLLADYPCRAAAPRDDNFGIALLSRLACATSSVLALGEAEVPSVMARVRVGGREVTVVGTHPLPPAGPGHTCYRNGQLREVAGYVRGLAGPVLLLGDLNATPWSSSVRALQRDSGLRNSARGRGLQPTWPTYLPLLLIPIDQALHTADLVIRGRWVGGPVGSDHYPVIVDAALAP